MAVTIAGFAGSGKQVNEAQWARIMSRTGGAAEHVEGDGLAVTPTATARQVSIATGYGYGCGVEFLSDAAETVTASANSSGSTRYDMVVAQVNWSAGTVTFTIREGVSDVTTLTRTPGTSWDVPLALLVVADGQGVFASTDVVDLRPLGRGVLELDAASGWTPHDTYPAKAVVHGDTVTLEGLFDRTGANTNLSGSIDVGYLPARLVPYGQDTRVRTPVFLWSQKVGSSQNERHWAPLYSDPGVTVSTLRLWKPADVTPRFIQGTSFIDLSGVSFTKAAY